MPDISVIVVNWNTRDLLRRCLDSVLEDGRREALEVEVVVVDNGSRDGSQEMVQSNFPGAILLQNAQNAGFARANNQGAALATAPLLLLLNSDAALQPGALGALLAFMRERPEVAIAGLQLLNDDLTLQPSGRRFPSLAATLIALLPLPMNWRREVEQRHEARDYSQEEEVDEVSGAAMAIRRDRFQQLEGFDEHFFFFGEDIDLCWRARKAGYAVAYLPRAQAIHTWGSARARTPSIRQGLLSQVAQLMLFERHKPAWQAVALRAALVALTAARLGKALVRLAQEDTATAHTNAHLYARALLRLTGRR